jgi:hypothetical protein
MPSLRGLGDVPIERDRIGAMGIAGPPDQFRPYVYRGIGDDLYEMPKPRPWPESKPKRKHGKPEPVTERVDTDLIVAAEAAMWAASVLANQEKTVRPPEPVPAPEPKKPKPKVKKRKHEKPAPLPGGSR